MMRVLFVDDEQKVLDGLRRMLYSLRNDMQMGFATGGTEALEFLEKETYDVVVSDMRMPGMDGSELLREIMVRYPSTIRLVLSGQCDRETVLKSVEATHRFLTKPCDPESIRTTLLQARELQGRLVNDHFREIVTKVTCVRSYPPHYEAVARALDSPGTTMGQVGQIVAQDVGLSARILQLTHSGYFGTPQRFTDPARATGLFDLETFRELMQNTGVFAPLSDSTMLPGFLAHLFQHSQTVAGIAREIARAESDDPLLADDCYVAGLLHDVGILVLAEHAPAEVREALRLSGREGMPLFDSECECFGLSHAEVGAYLMALWGLPSSVVEAVRFHHRPGASNGTKFEAITAVHVANAVHDRESRVGLADGELGVDTDYLQRLGLADRLGAWIDVCQDPLSQGVSS
jgi:HD-like signal output (HDOD) protein/CheY-like chemotaxis protein